MEGPDRGAGQSAVQHVEDARLQRGAPERARHADVAHGGGDAGPARCGP